MRKTTHYVRVNTVLNNHCNQSFKMKKTTVQFEVTCAYILLLKKNKQIRRERREASAKRRLLTAGLSASRLFPLCQWQSCNSWDYPELPRCAGPDSPRWWSSWRPPVGEKPVRRELKGSGHRQRREEEEEKEEDPTCNWETSMAFCLTSSCCFCSRFITTSSCLRCASSSSFWTLDNLWSMEVENKAEKVNQSQGILPHCRKRDNLISVMLVCINCQCLRTRIMTALCKLN